MIISPRHKINKARDFNAINASLSRMSDQFMDNYFIE